VSEAIVEHRAAIGGEGNGSVAIPLVHPTHDAAAAMAFILERLAVEGGPLSARVAELPRLVMIKDQIAIEPNLVYTALQSFRDAVADSEARLVDTADGTRLEWPDGWVHVRASNTESIIRVIAESDTQARARELADWARDRLPV
jgi:phosphomannomutase